MSFATHTMITAIWFGFTVRSCTVQINRVFSITFYAFYVLKHYSTFSVQVNCSCSFNNLLSISASNSILVIISLYNPQIDNFMYVIKSTDFLHVLHSRLPLIVLRKLLLWIIPRLSSSKHIPSIQQLYLGIPSTQDRK